MLDDERTEPPEEIDALMDKLAQHMGIEREQTASSSTRLGGGAPMEERGDGMCGPGIGADV